MYCELLTARRCYNQVMLDSLILAAGLLALAVLMTWNISRHERKKHELRAGKTEFESLEQLRARATALENKAATLKHAIQRKTSQQSQGKDPGH